MWTDNVGLRSIPQDVRPDLGDLQHCERKKLSLRLRYILCKSFIHRPFLLHVLSHDAKASHSQEMLDHSKHCIEACRSFLLLYHAHIDKPRSILWNIAQVIFGASLVLIASSRHVITSLFVASDLEEVIDIGLGFLSTWAGCSPSIDFCYQRLSECKENRQPQAEGSRVARSIRTQPEFFLPMEPASLSHFSAVGPSGSGIRLPTPVTNYGIMTDPTSAYTGQALVYEYDIDPGNPFARHKRPRTDQFSS